MTKANSSDELEIFKTDISLVEYALSQGYEKDEGKSTKNSVFMKRGSSSDIISITTEPSGVGLYWDFHEEKAGSIIDFVQKKQGITSLGEVRKLLRPWCGLVAPTAHVKKAKEAATKAGITQPAIAAIKTDEEKEAAVQLALKALKLYTHSYLTEQRHLSAETLKAFSAELRQDKYNNACFLHRTRNRSITGWEKKSQTHTRFEGRKSLFMHKVNESQATRCIVIFESTIDAMSFYQLGKVQVGDVLVSTAGMPTSGQKDLMLELAKTAKHASIAVDNDDAGDRYTEELKAIFTAENITVDRQLPKNKDWNEDIEEKMGFKTYTPREPRQRQKKTAAQTAVSSKNQNIHTSKSAAPILPPKHLQEKAKAARLEEQIKTKVTVKPEGKKGGKEIDQESSIVAPLNLFEFFNIKPKSLDFLWEGGPLVGTVGALIAPGGAGKSFFALEAAIAIAAQEEPSSDLLKIKPSRAGVVEYYVLEDPQEVLRHRLYALGESLSDEAKELLQQNLRIRALLGEMSFDLSLPELAHKIIKQSKGSRLIIIDTLSRSHTLDENKNGEMAGLLKQLEFIAKKTDAAVIFLHHTNKSSAREGLGAEQQSARGASVLIDNARWCGFVQTMTKAESENFCIQKVTGLEEIGEDRGFYVQFGVSKQNYGSPVSETWYKRVSGGVLMPVSLINKKDGQDKKEQKGDIERESSTY